MRAKLKRADLQLLINQTGKTFIEWDYFMDRIYLGKDDEILDALVKINIFHDLLIAINRNFSTNLSTSRRFM